MNAVVFLGFWLTIMGAAMLAGLAAHDGIPIKESVNIIPPVLMMIGGLFVGCLGSGGIQMAEDKKEPNTNQRSNNENAPGKSL
jgi:hypothetical protein